MLPLMLLTLASIFLFFLLNLLFGSVHIPLRSVWNILWGNTDESVIWQNIIWKSRVPQALTALVAGAGLSVSGLQMLKEVDLGDNRNLFVVSAILVCGIGGLALNFGTNKLTGGALLSITSIATALIVGIITNLIVNIGRKKEDTKDELSAEVSAIDDNTASFSDDAQDRQ